MKWHNAEKIGVIGVQNLPTGRAPGEEDIWHFVGLKGAQPNAPAKDALVYRGLHDVSTYSLEKNTECMNML